MSDLNNQPTTPRHDAHRVDHVVVSRHGSFTVPADIDSGVVTVDWTVELYRLEGNQTPHWSITGSVWDGTIRLESRLLTTGAIGDHLAAIWPEHFTRFNDLHLCDGNGVPMHAAANARYHLGFTAYPDAKNLATCARHLRITDGDTRALRDTLAEAARLDPTGRTVEQQINAYVDTLRPRWNREAVEAFNFLTTAAMPGSARHGDHRDDIAPAWAQ